MRWFDFFPLYDAASKGANFVEDNKFVADEKAMENVFDLMSTLSKDKVLRTGEATDPFENGDSVMTDIGPWTFPNWAEKYPELKFGDENNDMKLLETTSLIPARDDATENAAFKEYFEKNPVMEVYAANVPNAVPAMDNEKYNDIQQVFGEQAWGGEKAPEKAVTDAKKAVEGALQ